VRVLNLTCSVLSCWHRLVPLDEIDQRDG
jgi:hypothetical protein